MRGFHLLSSFVILLLLLSGCHRTFPAESGLYRRSIVSEGVTRWYYLYLPADFDLQDTYPLVFVFHGGAGNPDHVMKATQFNTMADRNHSILVYPAGSGQLKNYFLSWNAGDCCGTPQRKGTDDVAFSRAIISEISQEYLIDPDRVFATGHSNGALMTYRLACEASDVFSAIAPVAGTLLVSPCTPDHAVSILHIHGLEDPNLPFNGGYGTRGLTGTFFLPVQEAIDFWADLQQCESPASTTKSDQVIVDTFINCESGTEISLYTLLGRGHAWPVTIQLPDSSTSFQTSELIWQFFALHPRK